MLFDIKKYVHRLMANSQANDMDGLTQASKSW
jgi:hypothetical protein